MLYPGFHVVAPCLCLLDKDSFRWLWDWAVVRAGRRFGSELELVHKEKYS